MSPHKNKKAAPRATANIRLVDDSFDRMMGALLFLSEVDPAAERFTFQTFDDVRLPDGKPRKDETLTRVLHGTIADHWDELHALNEKGGGIYFSVNTTDFGASLKDNPKGSKRGKTTWLRAIHFDHDHADRPLPEFPIEPSLIVPTSTGKLQLYWLVTRLSHRRQVRRDYGQHGQARVGPECKG